MNETGYNSTANNWGVSGSGNLTVEQATKTPEIEMALRELEKEIYVMTESLEGLSARLSSVMRPDVAKDTGGAPKISQPHSQYYANIENLRLKVVDLNTKLSNIKQCLEI